MNNSIKKCGRCKLELPIDCFGIDNKKPDKKAIYCKKCRVKYQTLRNQTIDGKATVRVNKEIYYRKNRSKLNEYSKKRYKQKIDALHKTRLHQECPRCKCYSEDCE